MSRPPLIEITTALLLFAFVPRLAAAQTERPRPGDLSFLDVPPRPREARAAVDPENARGLLELEREMDRFSGQLNGYRSAVDRLTARGVRRARREHAERYDAQIRVERGLEAHARDAARARLLEFVRAHPDAPQHTPDALLRLAELELSRAQEAQTPSYQGVIEHSRRIVVGFPSYRRRDRAHYLLGWALTESNRADEGLSAYRALVCASSFRYPETSAPSAAPYPALQDGTRAERPAEPPTYAGCRASMETPLTSEIWLRIGEHHFDESELDAAIGAYRRVIADPDTRLFAFGLYKLAWSRYRAGHYAQALERFSQLVQHSDEELRQRGRAGSELREEAIQYLAITIAYDDWNEDGTPDHAQGGAHPLERLEDGALWPQDRPWAREVYRRVGDVLFEEGHADEAIVAWRLLLARYPNGCEAPDVHLAILGAYEQLGQDDDALRTLADLAGLSPVEGACPERSARRARLAGSAVLRTARIHHRRAQRLRQRGELEADALTLERARREYGFAVAAYRAYLGQHPNAEDRYELRYDLAEALFWSERYHEAALAYAAVRDSQVDDRLLARAARRTVEAFSRARSSGATSAGPDEPGAIPLEVQQIARAREIYLRWVPDHEDVDGVLGAFALENAALLERFGYLDEARARYQALFDRGCRGPHGSAAGRSAWLALRDDAVGREDLTALATLTDLVRDRGCTFAPEGEPVLQAECGDDANGEVCADVRDLEVRVALARLSEARTAPSSMHDAPARRARAREVASQLIRVASGSPAHPLAPAVLYEAGLALEMGAEQRGAAELVFQRLVDDYSQRPPDHELDAVLANAHFRLAYLAQRGFEHELAVRRYATIAESARFARSTHPEVRDVIRDALVNRAFLSSRLHRHSAAAAAWARAAAHLDGPAARDAQLREAEAHLRAGDARTATRRLSAWLRTAPRGRSTIRAHWLSAEAARAMGAERQVERALRATVESYRAEGLPSTSPEASLAARAALRLADLTASGRPDAPIDPGRRASMTDYLSELRRQVQREAERTRQIDEAYAEVITLRRAPESVAALRRRAQSSEELVRSVLGARWSTPVDVEQQSRGASRAVREETRARLEDAFRRTLDEVVRPIECQAIERYALAARLARRASLSTPDARRAHERLAAYGDERVRECLASAHQRDSGFAEYRPGEFRRARDGRHRPDAALSAARLAD